jgi:nitroimidazol reductase NimA-like FMN-containing flavoprotein (pyridoxamine 5'-phosphate oxidase superfamily)
VIIVLEKLSRFLQGSVHGKLVSLRERRSPHTVIVNIYYDGNVLYIRTLRHSVKVRNERRHPLVTVIVDREDPEAQSEQGFIRIESAMIEGECQVIEPITELPPALFAEIFSEIAATPDSPEAQELKASRVVLKITPQRVRYQRGRMKRK